MASSVLPGAFPGYFSEHSSKEGEASRSHGNPYNYMLRLGSVPLFQYNLFQPIIIACINEVVRAGGVIETLEVQLYIPLPGV
jgi:hypothetical protein